MSDEQDMRKMGGLWRRIPFTYAMMVIGTLSLMGFPLTAGYFSKDAAIFAAYARGTNVGMFAFVIGCFVAFLTALYSWRLIFMTFHGKPRASDEVMHHVHESPLSMLLPLVALAIGALLAGALFAPVFIGEHWAQFWHGAVTILPAHDVMAHIEAHKPLWVELLPTAAGFIGLALAWYCYIRRPDIPVSAARTQEPLYLFLLHKWYFDELYEVALVRPAKWLGRVLWKGGDGAVIDGVGPDGVAATVLATTRRVVLLQTGYLYHYAFAMLLGVALLVTYYMFAGPQG
jgi:NADH-quinone oxidoreductase subunit L